MSISAKERREIPDSQMGVPGKDKYPLDTKKHIKSAAHLINNGDITEKEKVALAEKIKRRAKEEGMSTENMHAVNKITTQQEQVPPMSDGTSIGNAPPGTFAPYNEEDELLKRAKMLRKPDPLTLERVREIVAKIHAKYKADSKPPTGNQNCQLCTWCAEAQFRGIDVLPRPIYSPRDPALDVTGESIVLSPVRLQFKSMSDMMGAIADIPYGRFYVHVKWKGGSGGHEFLLVGLNVPFVVDAQQGFVEPITSAEVLKDYFDIDWHESYLCRLDDKELNRPILDSMNDPAKVVPWDNATDVRHMHDHGMLADMSGEYTMRPATESDLEFVYQSELETVGENKDDPKVQEYIRQDAKESLGHTQIVVVGDSDVGVYQAYETNYYGLREGKRDWWYLAHIYIKPEYRSLGIGSAIIKKDIEEHDKILLQVMKSNPRAKKLYESLGFVVTQENDHGGLIMRLDKAKSEAVQEVACAASLLTVKNQLSQQLGSDYEFIGGSLVPKFIVKSKQKPELSFEVNVNGANIEVTPCYNNIPDFIHKRKGIAFMQAANVVAKFIEDTVREYKPVQESFMSGYMPKYEWPDFAKMKINHIRKWPHNEHGDEEGWEIDEDDGTFTSRLDQKVGFWLIKVFKYWAMVPDFAWDIKELGDFDFDPYNEVDENDWPLDMSWPNIINDLLRETIRASEATVWLVEDFDLLPEDRQKIHEGYSKFDHKEFIENMTDVGNLAEQMLDSPVLHMKDLNHEVTTEDMKQIADIRDVGKLFIDIVYDWVNNYQSKGIKEMYLREMKSYDRRDQPRKTVQESFSGKTSYGDEINQLLTRIKKYEDRLQSENNAENADKIRIHLVGLYMDLIKAVDYATHDTWLDDAEMKELTAISNEASTKYVKMIPDIKRPTYSMVIYQYAIVAHVDWSELRKFINEPGEYSDFLTEWLYLRATGSSKDPTNDKLPTFKGCKEIAQFIKGEITYEEASRKCDEYVTEAVLSIVNDILHKKSKHVQEAFADYQEAFDALFILEAEAASQGILAKIIDWCRRAIQFIIGKVKGLFGVKGSVKTDVDVNALNQQTHNIMTQIEKGQPVDVSKLNQQLAAFKHPYEINNVQEAIKQINANIALINKALNKEGLDQQTATALQKLLTAYMEALKNVQEAQKAAQGDPAIVTALAKAITANNANGSNTIQVYPYFYGRTYYNDFDPVGALVPNEILKNGQRNQILNDVVLANVRGFQKYHDRETHANVTYGHGYYTVLLHIQVKDLAKAVGYQPEIFEDPKARQYPKREKYMVDKFARPMHIYIGYIIPENEIKEHGIPAISYRMLWDMYLGTMKEIYFVEDLRNTHRESHAESIKSNPMSTTVQEGAIQDIKNGVNPFSDDLVFHVTPDKHIDGQVWQPRVPDYLEPYNPEDTGFEDNTTGRICFSTSIEGALNGITVNLPRQNPAQFDKMYVYIPEKPWKEYKHKTNKELVKGKLVYDANVTREVWIMEPVRMKLYGVIKVDQVSDANRKAVVPTSKGQKDTRNYFTYKWHWVVKPKVLKKATKFDYSVETVLSNLCIDIKKFKYGLIRDGRLVTGNVSDADYEKYWVFHSGEEVDQAGGGNCYDMVEYEAGYLEAYGVTYKKYFMNFTKPDGKTVVRTHTICVVPHDGKYIYIEQAFKRVTDEWGDERQKTFETLDDLFYYVAEVSAEYDNQDLNFGVWDYTNEKIDYGTPIKNFQDWIFKKCKMVQDGEVKKKSDKEA